MSKLHLETKESSDKPFFHVAVGILINEKNELLLAQRPTGKPWAGWWEFPGGKLEANESIEQALIRELKEELGITAQSPKLWKSYDYEYPETCVRLEFCFVKHWEGQIQGLENQAFSWFSLEQAEQIEGLLPATHLPLRWLKEELKQL